MPRNRYLDAAGVVALRWQKGVPSRNDSPVIVEVWRSGLSAGGEMSLPTVNVRATLEMWVYCDDAWQRIESDGSRTAVKVADVRTDVRRWAPMAARSWHATVNIDGWGDTY